MSKLCMVFMMLAALSAGGCATITSSEMQRVGLTTSSTDGKPVEGVKCSFQNDKGAWEGTSPGFISVHKSSQDLSVECKKDGQPDGRARAISRVGAGMFGNILFGGGIGAIIDHTTGTAYNYPENIPVVMGGSVTIDRGGQQSGTAASGAAPGATGQAGPAAAVNSGSAAGAGAGSTPPSAGVGPATAPPVSDFDRQRAAVSK